MDNPDTVFGNAIFDGMRSHLKPFHPEQVKNFYYDTRRKDYYALTAEDNFITLNAADIKRRLKMCGIAFQVDPLTGLSPIDDAIQHIQDYNNVQYAGPLAGHSLGYIEQNGCHVLVTSAARPFEVKKNSSAVFLDFVDRLLGHDVKQLFTFLYWFRGIHFDKSRPRQCLVIAGEAGCGKSLLQAIITHTLGGRVAKPYSFLIGATDFNSDMFGAEHLVIDDESASTDYRSRERLGNQIKQIVVGTEHRLHAKGRDALNLCPWWVLSFSLNDEPENLQVLPRMEKSLEDKIILLKAIKNPLPMPTGSAQERKAFWDALCQGASNFLYLFEDEVPLGEYHSERYIVKAYHHPELLRALTSVSKEGQFLELIDEYIKLPYEGSAAKLEQQLRIHAPEPVDQLFTFPNACAALLGRLRKLHPERFENVRTRESRNWHIKPALSPE